MKAAKVGVFIQARSDSTRLPGKIYSGLPYDSDPSILEHIYHRMSSLSGVHALAVIIPYDDIRLRDFCHAHNIPTISGSPGDVRERYRLAARITRSDVIVRVTGDNPCVDVRIARDTIREILNRDADLLSYSNLPLGAAVEAFRDRALFDNSVPDRPEYREHVSLHIKHNPTYFNVVHLTHPIMKSFPMERLPRLTVDTPEDLEVVRHVFHRLGGAFFMEDVLKLYLSNPELFQDNTNIQQITFSREP